MTKLVRPTPTFLYEEVRLALPFHVRLGYDLQRFYDMRDAIDRFLLAKQPFPITWFDEVNLIEEKRLYCTMFKN